jgi:hypothetical protein
LEKSKVFHKGGVKCLEWLNNSDILSTGEDKFLRVIDLGSWDIKKELDI